MTSGFSPAVARLDPDEGATADFWDRLLIGTPRPGALLLLADAAARLSGWAPRAALTLAEALAQRYGGAIVVDLQLDQPVLHRVAGIRNDEGIADALVFGASLDHVAVPVVGGTARVVPSGPFVPAADEVLGSASWGRVVDEATATGGGLLLYAPLESPLGELSRRIPRAVVLRGSAEDAQLAVPPGVQVSCIVTPPLARPRPEPQPAEPEAAAESPDSETPADRGAPVSVLPPPVRVGASDDDVEVAEREREALVADLRARQQAALAGVGAPRSEPRRAIVQGPDLPAETGASGALSEPLVSHREAAEPESRRRGPVVLLTLLLLALIAALAGFWHYFGREYFAARTASQSATADVRPPAEAPRPAGEPLPYSVAIEAHPDLPTAAGRATSLTEAEPAIGFYIAPLLIDSALYYRVMAGPLRDSVTAAMVMDTLVAKGHKTGGSEYDIRSTPLTFLLGDFASREEAERRMEELHRLAIPSYVVELPYSSGPSHFRVYSGAYAGPAEADVMRQFLQNVGLADTLVLRTGRTAS